VISSGGEIEDTKLFRTEVRSKECSLHSMSPLNGFESQMKQITKLRISQFTLSVKHESPFIYSL